MLFPGNGESESLSKAPFDAAEIGNLRDRVASLTTIPAMLDFCDFIVEGLGARDLPDYETIDLIKVPRLAPHIFVHDYRGGLEKGMLVKFSGTAIDEHYGKVLQGRYIEDIYTGNDGPDRYFPLHHRAIAERRPFFARRTTVYDAGAQVERYKLSSTLYFPCSSDGETVNYGIGAAFYEPVRDGSEPVYLIL